MNQPGATATSNYAWDSFSCGPVPFWVGELKGEFAQSIGHAVAERMSRIPLNKSEWLRRSERVKKRANQTPPHSDSTP